MPVNYNRYPSDWFGRLHRIVWNRAQGKCEKCGLHHGSTVMSIKMPMYRGKKRIYRVQWHEYYPEVLPKGAKLVVVVLTKAHLDHDADNKHVHPSRLRLWCQLCHLRYDAYMKAQKRLGLATESGNQPDGIGLSYRPVAHRFPADGK